MAISRRYLVALPAALWLPAALAQQARPLTVGVLVNGAAGTPLAARVRDLLQDAFTALGYGPERVALKFSHADGKLERLPALARELAAAGVDMIFALGGPASRAAADATSTIPVVFSIVTDPVALRLVDSMQAPGRNVTGVTNLDRGQATAQMQLLKEAAPLVSRVAVLSDADIPGSDKDGHAPIDRDNLQAAQGAGLAATVIKLKGPTPDLDAAFAALAKEGTQAIIALEVPVVLFHRERIARLASSHRMVSLFPGGTSDAGGVLTFGTTVMDTWKRMPAIADRIVKGTPPATIPVETVMRRELVVNTKAASEIGLTLPQQLIARADKRLD
ncbi:ABC transporter substrate-binding protein [Ramlibacter tataouinensis]|uniref:ABC transporter substrate-binding protein n=1 Tax=Ramlibacter tataouinensis TaxID=94132 RepID=UPI0013143708|nr:ABC transporter substrate-binding protein [Ramlibacter tataouinensis]